MRGEKEVLVTARAAGVDPLGTERVLDRLIAEGVVIPAPQPKHRAGAPINGTGTVSDLVSDQRR